MSKEIKLLDEKLILGKEFKIYGNSENPLFLAKDVAKIVEHSNVTKMLASIDVEDKVVLKTPTNNLLEGLQKNTEYTFLTEEGLYEVLMLSRKLIAKQFKKEVKKILKEIRQNGGYIVTSENDTDEVILSKALLIAQKTIERKNKMIEELENVVEKQTPKVELAETLLISNGVIDMGAMAKLLKEHISNLGRNTLFKFLRSKKVLMKNNTPYQSYSHLFVVKEKIIQDDKIALVTLIKPKGQEFIYKLCKRDFKKWSANN